jgi:beta-glucosidase/6-phospho-beta-glucosidase/beta-galactosidase
MSLPSRRDDQPLFRSFWQAGFESASHINGQGVRVDMLGATQHVEHADADYARLSDVGIRVAREGIPWPVVEQRGAYDVSSVQPIMAAASAHDVQVIWTLCHYGWPDDLEVFSPAFVERFARYCATVARFVRDGSEAIPLYVPINEISFLAWAAGQVGWFHPFARGRGDELKAQLVRAAIAGIEAIWDVDPRARIVHVEPVVNVVPPGDRPDLADLAREQTEGQFAVWDWLAGYARPELGGHPRYLEVMGVNFYHDNQWEALTNARLAWDTPAPVRASPLPLRDESCRCWAERVAT